MSRIHEAVKSYIAETGWAFEEKPDQHLIVFPIAGKNGDWLGVANSIEEDEQLVVHSVMSDPVPTGRRNELTIFVTRANFGMAIGNFELDLDEGELRFRTSIDLEGSEVQPELVRQLILANVMTTDLYMPGVRAVLNGATAEQAMSDLGGEEAR